MPQPREHRQPEESRNQQDQSPNNQGKGPRQAQDTGKSDKQPNPDRDPDQGKQPQKPSDVRYAEQDPSGKAERPDAVDGAEPSRPDRGKRDRDLN